MGKVKSNLSFGQGKILMTNLPELTYSTRILMTNSPNFKILMTNLPELTYFTKILMTNSPNFKILMANLPELTYFTKIVVRTRVALKPRCLETKHPLARAKRNGAVGLGTGKPVGLGAVGLGTGGL